MSQFFSRIVRAARLDTTLYEEVEADKSSMPQAMGVVLLSGLAAGVGTIGQIGGYGHVLPTALAHLAGWFIWAALTYLIGTRLLPEPQTKADLGELLRTIGFASAPGMIRVLGILPGLTEISFIIAFSWMLVTMVIAVRQALDYKSTGRAVGVCAIGWFVQIFIFFLSVRVAAL